MAEQALVPLLVKLGIVSALASILVRSSGVKKMLLREGRTLYQRLQLALWFAVVRRRRRHTRGDWRISRH